MQLIQYEVQEFIRLLASKNPAPGGGSASALMGALGAALSSMAANLTAGREKYRDKEVQAQEILREAQHLTEDFLILIDQDTTAYNQVMDVFKMPKDTEEEKLKRSEAMESALQFATKVPFSLMEKTVAALKVLEKAVDNTNPSASSDLGVGAYALFAGLQGAWLNVLTNLAGIKDDRFITEYKKSGKGLLQEGKRLAEKIGRDLEKKIEA